MEALLELEVCIFVLIAVGFLLWKRGIVGGQGQKNITDLVLLVVLPCNIVTAFMIPLTREILQDCMWTLVVSVLIQAAAVLCGRLLFRREPDARRRNLAYSMICNNAGFLGNPMAEGVYGPIGLMLASIYLIPQRVMMWSRGLVIYSGEMKRRDVARKVLTHPCVIACFLGLAIMLSGFEVPSIILTPVKTLGRCNTALSMLVIGMILAQIDPRHLLDVTVVKYTVIRLILFPLGVWGICSLLPLSRTVTGLSTLLSAMPAGAISAMMASKYDQDPEFATKLVVFSTLCSIPTIMIWCIVLRA